MATAYTPDSLRNLFQSSFNLAQWYSFLQHFFNATKLKSTPERIIENTSDDGYYLGNIDTTDSYRIGLFHYNIRQGSVANKRVGLRNLVKSFINPTWGEFDAALVVFDSGDHWRLSFICDIKGEATSPKRYTYVFGSDDLLYRTPIERFNFLKKKGVSFENLITGVKAVRRIGPTLTSILGALQPLTAVVLGVAFLDEHLSVKTISGISLILVAVFIIIFHQKKISRKAH